MQIIYPNSHPEEIQRPSIFLAGPSPRSSMGEHWRADAFKEFERFEFDGTLFSPVPEDLTNLDGHFDTEMYFNQIDWEQRYLREATVIMFWVPRELSELPGFTTNIEFGQYVNSGKIVLGYPFHAANMDAFWWLADEHRVPVTHDLKYTVINAIRLALNLESQ